MNLFKKIFGKKEDGNTSASENENIDKELLKQDIEQVVKTIENSISIKVTVDQPAGSIDSYKPKYYKIPSVVKTARSKLKKEGLQSCINFVNEILDDTDRLQKDQSISLTRNFVKILKVEKHECLNNFDNFLNNCLLKYKVQTDPLFYGSIAEIYNEYNSQLALDYLAQKNNELLNVKTLQSLNYYLFLDKVRILIEQNDLSQAEKEIQNANKQIENNSMFQFLTDKIKFANLYSELKLIEKDYVNHFKYYIVSFMLDIAKDISNFPIGLNGFHYRKTLCYSGGWGLKYNDLEGISEDNKISKERFDEISKEIYDLVFYHLPILMGIEAKYVEKESSADDLRKDYPMDWFTRYNYITEGPFTYYEFIEKFIDDIIEKNTNGKQWK